jgi:hypothetical protein
MPHTGALARKSAQQSSGGGLLQDTAHHLLVRTQCLP